MWIVIIILCIVMYYFLFRIIEVSDKTELMRSWIKDLSTNINRLEDKLEVLMDGNSKKISELEEDNKNTRETLREFAQAIVDDSISRFEKENENLLDGNHIEFNNGFYSVDLDGVIISANDLEGFELYIKEIKEQLGTTSKKTKKRKKSTK